MMSPISATVLNTLTPNKYIINLYIYFIHLSLGRVGGILAMKNYVMQLSLE